MARTHGSSLPKDRNVQKNLDQPIKNVSDYLRRISEYIEARREEQHFFVYRGEPEIYPSPCRPGLFRMGALAENPFFEKNLFDTMRQAKLTGNQSYLDNAIDAQHGEFPSRLLDVTYNCLIALYFAVTPYYHRAEDALDDRDGMVFVFFCDEIFSPSAENINRNYDAIINQDCPWNQEFLFRKNQKFIDHTKLNNRIIAQQGAFILFQGDAAEELPKGLFYGIKIPKGAKRRLRAELKELFGIHTGSIYPEIINLVRELTGKSGRINARAFTCENELRYTLGQLKRELDYYLDYAVSQKRNGVEDGTMCQILANVEKVVNSYREGLVHLAQNRRAWEGEMRPEQMEEVLRAYNIEVEQFSSHAVQYELGRFSADSLKIEIKRARGEGNGAQSSAGPDGQTADRQHQPPAG